MNIIVCHCNRTMLINRIKCPADWRWGSFPFLALFSCMQHAMKTWCEIWNAESVMHSHLLASVHIQTRPAYSILIAPRLHLKSRLSRTRSCCPQSLCSPSPPCVCVCRILLHKCSAANASRCIMDQREKRLKRSEMWDDKRKRYSQRFKNMQKQSRRDTETKREREKDGARVRWARAMGPTLGKSKTNECGELSWRCFVYQTNITSQQQNHVSDVIPQIVVDYHIWAWNRWVDRIVHTKNQAPSREKQHTKKKTTRQPYRELWSEVTEWTTSAREWTWE